MLIMTRLAPINSNLHISYLKHYTHSSTYTYIKQIIYYLFWINLHTHHTSECTSKCAIILLRLTHTITGELFNGQTQPYIINYRMLIE